MFGERYEEFAALWCVRNEGGQERSGETRWQRAACGASTLQYRPDITRRAQADSFAAWLVGHTPQRLSGGMGRSFRAQTNWGWNIEVPHPCHNR